MSNDFIIIAGPCVIEGRDFALRHAEHLKKITEGLPIQYYYKSSYLKANRSSYTSFTGVGLERGLSILGEVKQQFGLSICTDVHEISHCGIAAEVSDILQIPAFLCRQTELIVAAGLTGKTVEIKKGQMVSAHEMILAAEKVRATGNSKILLAERGTFFGYSDHVVDFRNLEIMAESGYPVIYDATHSVQQKSGEKTTGGQSRFIPALARAAIAVGVSGVFAECHEDPPSAKSDAMTQIPLSAFGDFLKRLLDIHFAIQSI